MARRVFLSAGHTNVAGKDQGAAGIKDKNGKPYSEGVLAVEFTELLAAELKSLGIAPITDKYSNALAETMASFKRIVGAKDLAIEIHWNAGVPAATGAEVIIPGRAGIKEATLFELNVASQMSAIIAATLGIKNRGAKTEKDTARKTLGWMRIPCENILIEMCFITNTADMTAYQNHKKALAIKLAAYIKTII